MFRKLIEKIITYIVRKRFRKFNPEFVSFVTKEIFQTEKICRIGFPSYLSSYFPPFPSPIFRRFEKALISASKGNIVPEMVNIAVTERCNYACWHCSSPHSGKPELNTAEMKDLINQLIELGTYNIGFTGGEPLLREDICDLIAQTRGLANSLLFTTGYNFTPQIAYKLKKAGLTATMISMDYLEPEKHDYLRRYKGAFEIALRAVELSRKMGFLTAVTTVATPDRITSGELEAFIKWLTTIRVHEVTIFEPAPAGKLAGKKDVFLDADNLKYLKELHIRANNSKFYPRLVVLPFVESADRMGCQAGNSRVYISAAGEVKPCDFIPLSFGNIRKEALSTIISRMKKHFPAPRNKCFFHQFHSQLTNCQNDDMLHSIETQRCFASIPKSNKTPKFYDTLIKK